MAALPLTELETATRRHFMPVITNQIFKVSPVLYRIFKPAREGAWGLALPSFDGRSLAEPLEYAEASTAAAYKKDTTWTMGTTEVLSVANYAWRMYYIGIKIHNLDTEINKGRERVFDLAAIKLQNAVKGLRKALITDFYLASDDTDANERMIGIQGVVAADKTIGGITQSDHSWWQGNIDSSGAGNRDLTWLLLNKMFYLTKKYGVADRATLIVASEGVMQNYEDNLTKVEAAGGSASAVPLVQLMATSREGPRKIEGGFESFAFKRIPMVADPYAPANKAFFLNERYLHWRVLKNFDATGWTQQRVNGKDWAQNVIFGYGCLTSSANNKQGMISELNEA